MLHSLSPIAHSIITLLKLHSVLQIAQSQDDAVRLLEGLVNVGAVEPSGPTQ